MCDKLEIYHILLHAVFSEDFTTVHWHSNLPQYEILNLTFLASA